MDRRSHIQWYIEGPPHNTILNIIYLRKVHAIRIGWKMFRREEVINEVS